MPSFLRSQMRVHPQPVTGMPVRILSLAAKSLFALLSLLALGIGVLWFRAYWPGDTEMASVECRQDAPVWSARSPLKVMSYNVQYMASKNYVFFYDIDVDDPERLAAVKKANKVVASQPAEEHVHWTLEQVADVIRREDPDVVLLQEVNGGDDSRTHYVDQVNELLGKLPADMYACQSETSYWKAEFIAHPEILGPVNMKLLTLSRYRITRSVRHQLPRIARSFLLEPFHFQRALLESHIATDRGHTLALLNTHFDAWGEGTDIMRRQIARTERILHQLDENSTPWILGGDLNLLPPDNNRQRASILAAGTGLYNEIPELGPLYDKYRGIPSLQQLTSEGSSAWYTHFPNDPTVPGPDRTIDYLFYSDEWTLLDAYVRREDTLHISDHLPVIGIYSIVSPAP